MKRIFLLGLFAVSALISAAQGTSKLSYVTAKPEIVTSLKIEGDINVTLVIAPNEPNVYVEGSENFTKKVKTKIVDGVMTITAATSSKSKEDVVVVFAPSLSLLQLDGDVKFKTIGTIDAKNLELSINGNCRLNVQHTGELNIKLDDHYELTERRVIKHKAG